jgi:predicted adenylyl cyclase CyaB
MKEIEVKVLEINKKSVAEKIIGHGGVKIFDGDITTSFLDYQDNRIHLRKDVLRLRKENDSAELTYKKVHFDKTVKVAEETSVRISSLESALLILQNLGLTVKEKMEKHRTSFELYEVRIDIDQYYGNYAFIPEFLELEGPELAIGKVATLLGFQEKDCLPWSTDELIKYYGDRGKKEKV